MPYCLVINGPPCAGKSTLAAALVAPGGPAAGWPVLAKDVWKERVFDALGWSDRAWSARVSGLAWELLFDAAAPLLAARVPCVLEGNFRVEHGARLRALARDTRFVEIVCRAPPALLASRFRARLGRRHPGHVDAELVGEIDALAAAPVPALALGGTSLRYESEREDGLDRVRAALAQVLAAG